MKHQSRGFTIVELLIVIVIIGILATIVIVAYNGITTKARQVTLQSDLSNSRTKMEIANASDGRYPSAATVTADQSDYLAETGTNTLTYHTDANGTTYCISAVGSDNITYVISNLTGPFKGSCTGTSNEVATEGTGVPPVMAVDGTTIQTITSATCPIANKIRAVDARDNHTYWVQKLTDGKCWMLTNLGYAGGGTNTYSDTRTLTNGTGGATTYTVASYYVVPSTTNYTTEPTAPSTSTNGTGQYGYLYNFCAANGGQTSNGACSSSSSVAVDTTISICPAGWRLPVGNGAEFIALNNAINSGSTSSDAGLINAPWLGQRSGYWNSGFDGQGTSGGYWSSTQYSATYGYYLYFYAYSVNPASYNGKNYGFAIRCVAAV